MLFFRGDVDYNFYRLLDLVVQLLLVVHVVAAHSLLVLDVCMCGVQ